VTMESHLKKMIHGFFGLEETVFVRHGSEEFRIVFSRPSADPGSPVSWRIEGSDRVTAAARADDPVWTVVAIGQQAMFFRTSYSQRLGRAEIVLSADRSWRFSWATHTTSGVPEARHRS
jgi:hypothetical protein